LLPRTRKAEVVAELAEAPVVVPEPVPVVPAAAAQEVLAQVVVERVAELEAAEILRQPTLPSLGRRAAPRTPVQR
jgi:hypothetical protein